MKLAAVFEKIASNENPLGKVRNTKYEIRNSRNIQDSPGGEVSNISFSSFGFVSDFCLLQAKACAPWVGIGGNILCVGCTAASAVRPFGRL